MSRNVDEYAHGLTPRRYQVQTRSGLVWSTHCASDLQSAAFDAYRDARHTGYAARVVDTRTDKIIPVPR